MTKSKKKNKKKAGKIVNQAPKPKLEKKEQGLFASKKALLLLGIALLISFIAFSDTMNNSYVNWDDDRNFQENQLIVDLTAENFWEYTGKIFSSDVIGGYNPLSIWTFAVEKMVWGFGEDSWKYWHMDNILLHLVCVFFVFLIGRQLKLNIWATFFLALLFGIHPMRVESVAWLTERKDVLFASFYFAAIYFYLKGKLKGNSFKYVYIIIPLFILSGLSKIQAVSLPLSFIALDYYLDKQFSIKSIINNSFYFVLSLLIGGLGAYILSSSGVILTSEDSYNFGHRILFGAYGYMTYLAKFIYPWEMSPLYPYPSSFELKYGLASIPMLMLIAATVWAYFKGHKVWVFGMAFFTFNIMFVLQIVGAGQGFLADRFTYVPYFGLMFIAAYYVNKLDFSKTIAKVIAGVLALYLLLFAYKTYKQCDVWSNSYSLWTHVIQYYPKTKVTWGNRANWLRDNGYKDLALSDYTERLRLGAEDPEPFNSRGKLYFQSQNRDTLVLALADYKEAVRLSGKKDSELQSEYRVNMASTLARLNRNQEAIEAFNAAEKIFPANKNVYFNRSITFHNIGDFAAEQRDIISYLKIRPYDGAMISNLGTTKRLLGDPAGAEADFNRALKYNQMPAIFMERARNYLALGKFAEAKQDVRTLQQNGVQIPGDLLQSLGM